LKRSDYKEGLMKRWRKVSVRWVYYIVIACVHNVVCGCVCPCLCECVCLCVGCRVLLRTTCQCLHVVTLGSYTHCNGWLKLTRGILGTRFVLSTAYRQIRQCQGSSPVEPSQGDPSHFAHRASRALGSSVWVLASWNVQTLLGRRWS